jgi:hypothetical protein
MVCLLRCLVAFGFLGVSLVASLIPINVEAVKKAVVFLYSADPTGQPDTSKELATGFLVAIPIANSEPQRSYFVLVTARHVVDPVWACQGPTNPSLIYARVNRKDYDPKRDASGVEFVPLHLIVDNKTAWVKHTTDSVDAAVVPIDVPRFLANDVVAIRLADFGTPTEIQAVGIGDDIVSAGLVPGLSGKKRNYPFFKFGKVSNIPDEEGVMPCRGDTKALNYWYMAATLIGGNSGSPMFFLPAGNAVINFGGPTNRPFLLGLQSMSVAAGEIAGMTPVQYIFEIIESLKLPNADLTRGIVQNPSPTPKK